MGMRSARKEAREEGAIQVKVDGWNAVVCSEKCLAALKARYRRSK
jgi:ribosomal protein L24E